MKMWEDLLTKQDTMKGYEIAVFLKNGEVDQIVEDILNQNELPNSFEISVLTIDGNIVENIVTSMSAIKWLKEMKVQKSAIRIEMLCGTIVLVQQEELIHEKTIRLKETEDILNTVLNKIHQLTEGHLAVYTVEGVVFGEKEDLGFLREIEEIPRSFIQAESIKVKIFFAEHKEVLTLHFSYENEHPNL